MITGTSSDPLARRELLRRIGRLEQVAGIEPFVFDDGPGRGVRGCRFRTGSGLFFDVVPDRGMDLGFAEHKGTSLAWLFPNGVVAASFHEPEDEGWLNSFPGGLLVTCGLRNVGAPGERGGEQFGLHGRVSHIPASGVSYNACWDEEGCVLEASGQMREVSVFSPNLVLRRRISARVGESRVKIEDEGARLIGPGRPRIRATRRREEGSTPGINSRHSRRVSRRGSSTTVPCRAPTAWQKRAWRTRYSGSHSPSGSGPTSFPSSCSGP